MDEVIKLSAKGDVILKDSQVAPTDLDQVPHYMDFEVRMLGTGEVHSSLTGKSNITVEDVVGLYNSYNKELQEDFDNMLNTKAKRFGASVTNYKIDDFVGRDVRKNHSDSSVDDIVGRVKGRFRLEGSPESPELWGTLRIKGKENVIKVLDTRYTRLSVGFRRKPMHIRNNAAIPDEEKWPVFEEISFVQKGADLKARVEDQKLMHPVLLSGLENKENYNPQLEIVKLVTKQLDFIDTELDNLQETRKIKSELNRLAFNGKILPKMIRSGKILNDLLSIKNKADRNSVLELMDMMPNHLCLGGETNSLNATKGMEMVMAGDKTAIEKANDYMEACREKMKTATSQEKQRLSAQLRKIHEEAVKLSSTTNGIPMVGATTTVEGVKPLNISVVPKFHDLKFPGGQSEYLEGMEKLMSEGKNDDAKEYHAAYKKHCLEGKEISTSETEKLADEEAKLSGIKAELKQILDEAIKGEMEQVNVKLSGLTDSVAKVTGLAEQHKSLVDFIQSISKDNKGV